MLQSVICILARLNHRSVGKKEANKLDLFSPYHSFCFRFCRMGWYLTQYDYDWLTNRNAGFFQLNLGQGSWCCCGEHGSSKGCSIYDLHYCDDFTLALVMIFNNLIFWMVFFVRKVVSNEKILSKGIWFKRKTSDSCKGGEMWLVFATKHANCRFDSKFWKCWRAKISPICTTKQYQLSPEL